MDQYAFSLLQEWIHMAVADRELKVVDAEGFAYLGNGALNQRTLAALNLLGCCDPNLDLTTLGYPISTYQVI